MKRNKFPFEILDYQQQHKPRTTKTHRGEVAIATSERKKEEAINTHPKSKIFRLGESTGPVIEGRPLHR